ncbi:hypothetical protein ARAM_001367 [Aspergillus rambellii]|uniref:Uncharacterized protein n=1 Tax=Aspergillus rambellii TaxID=308745 RepID=A0A0F8WLY8_9EURO|nr:hypothetical protein ARAM_001367 [Aspergillus rambellii]
MEVLETSTAPPFHRTFTPPTMPPSLLSYLRSTRGHLAHGASALDAAVHAGSLMEDDALFNCGRGSVFTSAGTIEMEASAPVSSESTTCAPPHPISEGGRSFSAHRPQDANGNPIDDAAPGGSMHSFAACGCSRGSTGTGMDGGWNSNRMSGSGRRKRCEEHLRGRGEGRVAAGSRVRYVSLTAIQHEPPRFRTAAARTACAMLRFSPRMTTLAAAVTAVAGAGGQLERSAGRRWGRTGERQGGIIGIEADGGSAMDDASGLRRGTVVFDFNCGGGGGCFVPRSRRA